MAANLSRFILSSQRLLDDSPLTEYNDLCNVLFTISQRATPCRYANNGRVVCLKVRFIMISIDLPRGLGQHLWEVVKDDYDGDLQAAISAFLKLHEKFGRKEQLCKDVKSIRSEVH